MMSIISSSPDQQIVRKESRRICCKNCWQVLSLTSRKSWSLTLLLQILLLLVLPVMIMITPNKEYIPDMFNALIIGVVTPISILFALIQGAMALNYQHQRNAVDVFHALPVRRFPLFWGRVLGGLLPILATQVITLAVVAIQFAFLDVPELTLLVILGKLGPLLLMTTAVYSTIVLAFVLTGTLFDALLEVFFLNAAWPLSYLSFSLLLDLVLPGFSVATSLNGDRALLFSAIGRSFVTQNLTWPLVLWWVSLIIIMLGLSAFIYHSKRSELAGQTFAMKLPVYLMQFSAVLVGSCLLGLAFYSMSENNDLLFLLGAVLGALIAHLIIEVMIGRGLKTFRHSMPRLGAYILILVISSLLVMTGGFGYDKRVPAVDQIKSISYNGPDIDSYYWALNEKNANTSFLTPENITSLHNLHQTIIDRLVSNLSRPYGLDTKDLMARLQTGDDQDPETYYASGLETITIRYDLKNGRTITRTYQIDTDDPAYEPYFSVIQKTTEYKLIRYPILKERADRITGATLYDKIGEVRTELDLATFDMSELLEALKEDILSQDGKQKATAIYGSLSISLENGVGNNLVLSDLTPAAWKVLDQWGVINAAFTQQTTYQTALIAKTAPEEIVQAMQADIANDVYYAPVSFNSYSKLDSTDPDHFFTTISDPDLINSLYAVAQPIWPEEATADAGYLVVLSGYYGGKGDTSAYIDGPAPCFYIARADMPAELVEILAGS